MAESFNLLRRVRSLDIAPELSGYSGVVIFAGQDDDGNNIEYRAGDRTGTVLEITNEWGSQAQADAIYRKIRGFKYQGYKADGTRIDPSSEIGDAITVSDIYGGVFAKKTTFGRHIRTDLEAPSKEEVEHEFQIQSPTNRQYERFTRSVRASLSITASKIAAEVEDRQEADNLLRASIVVNADNIKAKVSKTEGNDESDFWWSLQSDGWSVGSKEKTIFKVDKEGAEVKGIIRATGGEIGGFTIKSNYLSYNDHTWDGDNNKGIYIGTSGIKLGNNFKVDMQGNLTASSGTFSGNVYAGRIKYDENPNDDVYGRFNGAGITGGSITGNRLASHTVSTSYTSSGINASLANSDAVRNLFSSFSNGIYKMELDGLKVAGKSLNPREITINGTKYKLWVYS